jgi:tRNA A58 N-methylase Trm61
VRPDHRMVAHTGFLTSARLLQDAHIAGAEIRQDANTRAVGDEVGDAEA